MSPLRMNLPQIGKGELMDLVVPKDLMVSRRIHHLNSKLKYMGVLGIKRGRTSRRSRLGYANWTWKLW